MTRRQADALKFIRKYLTKNEVGPTYEEICAGIGLASKSEAHRLVHGLAAQGALRLRAQAGHHRAIEWARDAA